MLSNNNLQCNVSCCIMGRGGAVFGARDPNFIKF